MDRPAPSARTDGFGARSAGVPRRPLRQRDGHAADGARTVERGRSRPRAGQDELRDRHAGAELASGHRPRRPAHPTGSVRRRRGPAARQGPGAPGPAPGRPTASRARRPRPGPRGRTAGSAGHRRRPAARRRVAHRVGRRAAGAGRDRRGHRDVRRADEARQRPRHLAAPGPCRGGTRSGARRGRRRRPSDRAARRRPSTNSTHGNCRGCGRRC